MVSSLQSWDSTFSTHFQSLVGPFGWRLQIKEETREVRHFPPSLSTWTVVRKKAHRFRIRDGMNSLYNPLFEIYYKNRSVGHVKVDVQGWSTDYNYRVDVDFIRTLPLLEKLPFDDLVRHHITDFLASPLTSSTKSSNSSVSI